jgi:hypothetical protein
MARDAKGTARLLAVQRQMRRIEEAKLADLQRRVLDIRQEQADLVKAMNDDGALQSLFLDAMARRLKSLADQLTRAENRRDVQAVVVREEATKEKAAERLANRRAADERAEAVQRQLDEVLEQLAHPRDASLR